MSTKMELTLDPVALREATNQAIMGIMTPEVKQKIIQEAISTILRPNYSAYGNNKTPLQAAFEEQMNNTMRSIVAELVRNDDQIKTKIADIVAVAKDKLLKFDVDATADAIAKATVRVSGTYHTVSDAWRQRVSPACIVRGMDEPWPDARERTLGERIRIARGRAGLSQEQVAEVFGISRNAVSLWESDSSAPAQKKLSAIAEKLRCPPGWLLNGAPPAGAERRSLHNHMVTDAAAGVGAEWGKIADMNPEIAQKVSELIHLLVATLKRDEAAARKGSRKSAERAARANA